MKNHKRKVFIVGPFKFPWGAANSRRVYGLAKSFSNIGADVSVICGNTEHKLEQMENEENINFAGVNKYKNKFVNLVDRVVFQHVFGIINLIKKDNLYKESTIVVYGGHGVFSLVLLCWSFFNRTKLVADVVEWFDPHQLRGGPFGFMHLNAKFALKFLYPLFDGVIAISSWLSNRYKSKGGKLVTLPPMIEVKPFKTTGCFSKDSLKLIYAGSPGIKDELNTVISAVNNINCGSNLVELLILIPHKKYLNNLKNIDGNSIKVEVGVSHHDIHDYVGSADFSIVIRESKIFTNAGFSTKFVESLAAKTPVIANLTSDLGKYLIDTENGFVVNSTSSEDIEAVIRKAQLLSQEELIIMSKNAEFTAQRFFSFSSYSDEIERFFKSLEEDNV